MIALRCFANDSDFSIERHARRNRARRDQKLWETGQLAAMSLHVRAPHKEIPLRAHFLGIALSIVIVAVGFGSASFMFQFKQMPSGNAEGLGWDPWIQKGCVVVPEQQLVCGPADIVVYRRSTSL
jgi:hypothetical protein